MHDLAIVGAGPAGIATAYFLRDLKLDVTILEAGDVVGGRTRSVPVGGIPSNPGALFVYRDTPAEVLAAELGIRTAAFTPGTYGIHVNNETVVDSDNHRLIDQLPISFTAREQFAQSGHITDEAAADRAVGVYRRHWPRIRCHHQPTPGLAGPRRGTRDDRPAHLLRKLRRGTDPMSSPTRRRRKRG